jgi:hypothetical protein
MHQNSCRYVPRYHSVIPTRIPLGTPRKIKQKIQPLTIEIGPRAGRRKGPFRLWKNRRNEAAAANIGVAVPAVANPPGRPFGPAQTPVTPRIPPEIPCCRNSSSPAENFPRFPAGSDRAAASWLCDGEATVIQPLWPINNVVNRAITNPASEVANHDSFNESCRSIHPNRGARYFAGGMDMPSQRSSFAFSAKIRISARVLTYSS